MGKKEKENSDQYEEESERPYTTSNRRTSNHVIQRTPRKFKSVVRLKPLKDRQDCFQIPEFCPKGYTKEEFDLYREQFSRIMDLTRQDLRQILSLNKQDTTPYTKAELVHRCADGYALGKIPICPHCFGNIPIYDKLKGTYFCAGYRQGHQFIACESYFQKDDLTRIKPWNPNFDSREKKRLQRTEQRLKNQRDYQVNYKINKRDKLKKKAIVKNETVTEENQQAEKQDQILEEKKEGKQLIKTQSENPKQIQTQSKEAQIKYNNETQKNQFNE